MSSDEREWLPRPFSTDLEFPGEPLEVFGTGRLDWPPLEGVFFIVVGGSFTSEKDIKVGSHIHILIIGSLKQCLFVPKVFFSQNKPYL